VNLNNLDIAQVTARLAKFIAAIAIAGSALAGLLGGWTWAAGFLIGSVASYFNFRNLAGIAQSLGTPRSSGRIGALAWLLFRLILLVTGAFVIIKLTKINVYCVCAGLFAPVAAVVLEAILALTYAS
jgi:hypothetical protein